MRAPQKVAIIDIQDNLEEFVKLRAAHPTQSVMIIKMDVANKKGVEATYEEIKKTFGSIDIVVNVAGIFNDKDVQRTLLVNLVRQPATILGYTIRKVDPSLTGRHHQFQLERFAVHEQGARRQWRHCGQHELGCGFGSNVYNTCLWCHQGGHYKLYALPGRK